MTEFPWNIEDIKKKIPHRYPFLLIDRVISIEPGPKSPDSSVGNRIRARKNVTSNEPFFMGHFPENAVMPGVLQIEAMAQAGALAAMYEKQNSIDVLFAKVDGARFRRQVIPGDVLDIRAEITKEKSSILGVSCQIYCEDQLVAEADVVAKIFLRKAEEFQ